MRTFQSFAASAASSIVLWQRAESFPVTARHGTCSEPQKADVCAPPSEHSGHGPVTGGGCVKPPIFTIYRERFPWEAGLDGPHENEVSQPCARENVFPGLIMLNRVLIQPRQRADMRQRRRRSRHLVTCHPLSHSEIASILSFFCST